MNINSTQRLANLIRHGFRVLLVGGPGTAKTARFLAATKLLPGYRFFYGIGGRTCDLMDRLDAAGAVVPDVAAGVSRTLPLEALKEVLDCTEPAVWFWDEIGRAPLDVQGALNSTADELRRRNSPVVIVAATNRPQDKAGVSSLSEQLRSRFDCAFAIAGPDTNTAKADGPTFLTDWAGEVDGWCSYAAAAEFAPEVIAWHRMTAGRTLYTWKPNADAALRFTDYRTWEVVNRLLAAGIDDLDSVSAVIGRGPAAEFLAFCALRADLPTPAQVWSDPLNARLPDAPAAGFFIASVLARAVDVKQVPALLAYIERLPRHLTAFCARDTHVRLGKRLATVPEWNVFFSSNQTLFV